MVPHFSPKTKPQSQFSENFLKYFFIFSSKGRPFFLSATENWLCANFEDLSPAHIIVQIYEFLNTYFPKTFCFHIWKGVTLFILQNMIVWNIQKSIHIFCQWFYFLIIWTWYCWNCQYIFSFLKPSNDILIFVNASVLWYIAYHLKHAKIQIVLLTKCFDWLAN